MANKFDSANYPTQEPTELIVGDRLAWKRSDIHSDYDNTLYTLSYVARKHTDGTKRINITATASGDDYLVEVSYATTDDYEPGRYSWEAYITRDSDSERLRIDSGTWEVLDNKAESAVDPRSDWRQIVDDVTAVFKRKASKDQIDYSVSWEGGNHNLSRMPYDDLIRFYSFAKQQLKIETDAERIANGLSTRNKIQVRFKG